MGIVIAMTTLSLCYNLHESEIRTVRHMHIVYRCACKTEQHTFDYNYSRIEAHYEVSSVIFVIIKEVDCVFVV